MVHVSGPLETYVEGFESELIRLGFVPISRGAQLRLMAHLSGWLAAKGLVVSNLTVELVELFILERRASHTALFTHRALHPLLNWLVTSGTISADVASPRAVQDSVLLVSFEGYLRSERRLKEISVQAQVSRVRRFLNGYTPPGGISALSASDVTRALLGEGDGRQPVSVKKFGYVLRSFLRFCFLVGVMDQDLTGATLVVRLPQPSLLPIGVSPEKIQCLLSACDRNTAVGKRDYAVIIMLVRLGLRAGEVAGLRLDDMDWRHGELSIICSMPARQYRICLKCSARSKPRGVDSVLPRYGRSSPVPANVLIWSLLVLIGCDIHWVRPWLVPTCHWPRSVRSFVTMTRSPPQITLAST